ncbi:hypothetical protein GS501_00510 [Saccharibacter sp. 17.LH.SD]|nr:hypothetical protein [Saccharibacter sp. 17.LH.SD]
MAIGCTTAGSTPSYSVEISPNARVYTYLILNGMARGAAMLGKLPERKGVALMGVDEKARVLLAKGLKSPGMRNDAQTDRALEDLLAAIPQ